MKVCVILLCVCCLCWRTDAQSRTYLITAPVSLRLDAQETVSVQLFGFTQDVKVYVFLKTSMALDHVVLAQEVLTLTTGNSHQDIAKVQLFPDRLDKTVSQVILHVQSDGINHHLSIPVSRSNGFLFIQTDKPLYTPQQSVKVRVFSLNQELSPANRNVFLTFKDPDHTTVDIVEIVDVSNGIPSMKNPFKIPIKPKLGIWSIEARYSSDFTTVATADFEVKEYVLPSFSILVEPVVNYISHGNFDHFQFKVSARYLHGAPVADGEVFLRFGYVSGEKAPVIIPNSVIRGRLSSVGDLSTSVNMKKVLSKHNGPRDISTLMGKYLYIAVLLQEDQGGISQEAEFAAVKFVESPYILSLVSTPPFIKPGLPYNIQVLVKDHLDKPVTSVPVRLVERQLFRRDGGVVAMSCQDSTESQSNGLALFLCNTQRDGVKVVLRFKTDAAALPAASQAGLTLEAVAYHSPNSRYLYIDPPSPGSGLQVGQYSRISVYSETPPNVKINAISFLVLSKGKVVHFGSKKFYDSSDQRQNVNFLVTGSMVPSIRLLVYYILYGEGTSELVADSIWLDVRHKCVNGLQTELSYPEGHYRPKNKLQLDIRTNEEGLVALSAVDAGLFTLRPNYKDPVFRVLRHIEGSDQGCGGGGGKDSADVFRLAGLTFITNANAHPSPSSEACTAAVRPKRSLSDEDRKKKVDSYAGNLKTCCELGMQHIPSIVTCIQMAKQSIKRVPCQDAFIDCCEYFQKNMDRNHHLALGRFELGADFDLAPSLVRSYFPESWLWEVQPAGVGQQSVSRRLPDSLTTWEVKAVGMFKTGICVAEPVRVSVSLLLSVDVPLPYQVVRGEQLDLRGSVYNQQSFSIEYCLTLTVGPALCVLLSNTDRAPGLRSTACKWSKLPAGGVKKAPFTLMALEPGEHTLTFTLKTRQGDGDILEKKLRVVPEGLKQEEYSGGRLDPQGLYGSEKRRVVLKNKPPPNIVPNTEVERMVTINGEILGDFLTVIYNQDGLLQLTNLPGGSAEAELGRLFPLVQVYVYLETTASWKILGDNILENAAELRQKIRNGVVSISSFRSGDSSYSMWMNRKPSTWLTAAVVKTLAAVDQVNKVDRQALSESVAWLIRHAQQQDGSFKDKSSFIHNKFMAARTSEVEQSVYLTSFVLIALHKATSIKEPILQLRFHDDSMTSAANYISQHAPNVKSVYVRAVATYALTLHDPNSIITSNLLISLEHLARQKGHPAELRYWQESNVEAEVFKPEQSSGLTVETTAYVLLTVLLKSRIPYANPILVWLTQDQHYGQGFYSTQDTVLTLEALTEYSRLVPRSALNQDINLEYVHKGALQRVQLSQSRPVATPIQVTKSDDIIASTGYGTGVSNVKMKTVYYQTTPSQQRNCNFDLKIEMVGARTSNISGPQAPHLVACAKYKPPPNELLTESSLTVMKIQLPTGVEAYLEDLRQFRDAMEPVISEYYLEGNTVVILMDTVPSQIFLCVGFRIRTRFTVVGASKSLFSIYEPQDKGSICTKLFQEQQLQRYCVGEQCQCMTAACAAYREKIDLTLTSAKRTEETCRPHIKYAYRVTVQSSTVEGDFVTFTAIVREVLKNTGKELQAVSSNTEVDLIKKVTCSSVKIQSQKQYLVMGSSGSEVTLEDTFKYRLPLDSDALVELWPTDCSDTGCSDYILQLGDYALNLQLNSCSDV